MAPKTKQAINELNNDGNSTAALSTLQPGSRPDNDPKTRFEYISRVIGQLAAIEDNDINKFKLSMSLNGHEADQIPGGSAAKNASTISMKPSDASASVKEAIKADVDALLASDDGLSEDFKLRAATLFEAALNAQVQLFQIELSEQFEAELDEAIEGVVTTIASDLDTYVTHTAETWLQENELAVESSLRVEMYDDFMAGLKELFEQHYISVPEDKVDVLETLASKIDELETRMDAMITENADLKEKVNEYSRKELVDAVCEGLTMNEASKLRELAEGVDADTVEGFQKKLNIIKESTFVTKGKGTNVKALNESLDHVDEPADGDNKVIELSPSMERYARTISRTVRK